MSTDFSFFDDIVGRAAAKPTPPAEPAPTPAVRQEDKAAWPEQPAIPTAQKKPEVPISFEASRFSSDHWNPEQNTISAPDEPFGARRQVSQRRRPRPLSSIGQEPEAPQNIEEKHSPQEEDKPLLPAPTAEEFARARRKEMANRIPPQEVTESSRAWSKTVETIRAI